MVDQVPFPATSAETRAFEAMFDSLWDGDNVPRPRSVKLEQRQLMWEARIRASGTPHRHVAGYVLERGTYYPGEHRFLQRMTTEPNPSSKQLAWLNKIRYRNHI